MRAACCLVQSSPAEDGSAATGDFGTRIGIMLVGITLVGLALPFTLPAGVLPSALAGEDAAPAEERARAAVRWKLPHDFEGALAAAKEQKRLLIIKGVSFGIDHAGAQCATKGKW